MENNHRTKLLEEQNRMLLKKLCERHINTPMKIEVTSKEMDNLFYQSIKLDNQNPFYYNYLFSKKDIDRATITWQDKLWLWLFPTYVQINEGYAWHYKLVRGKYYYLRQEKLNSTKV